MIDVQSLDDFEQEYSALVDAVESLKRIPLPNKSEGLAGIDKWIQDVHQALDAFTTLPDPYRLTLFAEDLNDALSDLAAQIQAGKFKSPDTDSALLPMPEILYGKPTGAFSSGATVTLAPCDINGTSTGEDNVTVYLQASQASYTMTNSTTIPTTEIIPCVAAGDYDLYVLGRPKLVITNFQVDTTNHLLQMKTRDDWGTFCGTESDWVTVHTGDVC